MPPAVCGARLFRGTPQGLHERLGQGVPVHRARRHRHALPQRRHLAGAGAAERARTQHPAHLARKQRLQRLSRLRLDEGALQRLRRERERLWRLPLPGLPAGRRPRRHRPGVWQVAAARQGGQHRSATPGRAQHPWCSGPTPLRATSRGSPSTCKGTHHGCTGAEPPPHARGLAGLAAARPAAPARPHRAGAAGPVPALAGLRRPAAGLCGVAVPARRLGHAHRGRPDPADPGHRAAVRGLHRLGGPARLGLGRERACAGALSGRPCGLAQAKHPRA
jgi:hypothetical protein